jgi:four helix bundle protein
MKLTIAEEEADETCYWLEVLSECEPALVLQIEPLFKEARELTAILTASGKTAKKNLHQKSL